MCRSLVCYFPKLKTNFCGDQLIERKFLVMLFCCLSSSSSSSYELFVASIMQEDVYIGYSALALTLGLQVFS